MCYLYIKNFNENLPFMEDKLVFGFDLDNTIIKYEPKETTKETKTEKAVGPKTYGFNPQKKVAEYKADFQHNSISYVFEDKEIYGIDQAVTNLYTYLKDKDPKIAKEYPKSRLKSSILSEIICEKKFFEPCQKASALSFLKIFRDRHHPLLIETALASLTRFKLKELTLD